MLKHFLKGAIKRENLITGATLMNNQVYHLIVFIVSISAIVGLIVSGHSDASTTTLLTTVLGGATGGSVANLASSVMGAKS